jgi:hypothetical protein
MAVESREQGGGTVTLVVMRHRPGAARLHRKPRLLRKPGGNITGFLNVEAGMGSKWLELLKQIAPNALRRVRPRRRFGQMPTLDPNACAPFSGPDFRAPALGEAQPRLFLEDFLALREASPEPKNFRSPNFVENDDAAGRPLL